MEFPKCFICKKGNLLPLSSEKRFFYFWVCSNPNCGYTVKGYGRRMKEMDKFAILEKDNN